MKKSGFSKLGGKKGAVGVGGTKAGPIATPFNDAITKGPGSKSMGKK